MLQLMPSLGTAPQVKNPSDEGREREDSIPVPHRQHTSNQMHRGYSCPEDSPLVPRAKRIKGTGGR